MKKQRTSQRERLYTVLLGLGEAGATRQHLWKITRLNPKSIDARLYELEQEERAVQTRRTLRYAGSRCHSRIWVAEQFATIEDKAPRPPRNRATRELARLFNKLDAINEVATEHGYAEVLSVLRCEANGRRHTNKGCPDCKKEEPDEPRSGRTGQDGGAEPGRGQ